MPPTEISAARIEAAACALWRRVVALYDEDGAEWVDAPDSWRNEYRADALAALLASDAVMESLETKG